MAQRDSKRTNNHGCHCLADGTETHRDVLGHMSVTPLCLEGSSRYMKQVCICEKSFLFVVSVFQWVKDALIRKQLFMIAGSAKELCKSLLLIQTDVNLNWFPPPESYFTYKHISPVRLRCFEFETWWLKLTIQTARFSWVIWWGSSTRCVRSRWHGLLSTFPFV